ncbi:MAG: alpha/beta fold hydrolase [Bdellovibrionales bacterium]|nr:alpha/beta fold hydrolase [Bdellovibrionales bacterium]
MKNSIRSLSAVTLLALVGLGLTTRACALDAVNLDPAAVSAGIENFIFGYTWEDITFDYLGAPCSLRLNRHRELKGRAPIIMLHGITDSRDSFASYINYLRDHGHNYEDFVAIDYPHNGESKCDQAQTVEQVIETVHIAIEKLRGELGLPPPRALVGLSLGSVIAGALTAVHYPAAKTVWFSMPLLDAVNMKRVTDIFMHIETPEDAEKFVDLVKTSPERLPIPPLSYPAIRDRARRARVLLTNMNLDLAVEKLTQLDPANVRIVQGALDKLTPAEQIDPRILKRFGSRLTKVPCSHNLTRDCYDLLPTTFD